MRDVLREDRAIRDEREDADDATREGRAHDAALLATERSETDKDLSSERARADGALATRDDFLGLVSHELLNMLGTVVGFAELIETAVARENYADVVRTHAQRIQRSGGRMERLIGDLVDIASIEAGRLVVMREVGDLSPVVLESVEGFLARARTSGISLVTELAAEPVLVAFDPARILQVLTNLLSNAFKFTKADGRIVVRVERAGAEVRLSVRDTGAGIPKDQLEAVFERYRRVGPNDRRGMGLGLYISKSIVQGHGGRIWAESALGQGSTFCFTLPFHSAERRA